MDAQRFDRIMDGVNEDKLTEWETGFIESCKDRMETKDDLTPGQEEKLEEIYREKTRQR